MLFRNRKQTFSYWSLFSIQMFIVQCTSYSFFFLERDQHRENNILGSLTDPHFQRRLVSLPAQRIGNSFESLVCANIWLNNFLRVGKRCLKLNSCKQFRLIKNTRARINENFNLSNVGSRWNERADSIGPQSYNNDNR